MKKLLSAGAAAFILVAFGSTAAAQCPGGGPRTPAAAYKTLSGIILDEDNHPLEGAEVIIRTPRRQTKTGADGRFLIPLDTGTYDVIVRKIGFQIFAWPYEVPLKGGSARICLAREVRVLPPSITAVSALGLSGVIADSLMKVVPGAEVRAIGAGEHALTDSAGAFYMGLRPGTYAIVVSKPGYGRQLLSVTIPKDSGRQITAFLGPSSRNANRMTANFFEMHERMLWANPATSGIMSAEELMNSSMDVRAAAQRLARTGMLDDCLAIIDGGPYSLPISMIDKRDVAMVEAYALVSPRVRGVPQRPTTSPCGARVYVWIKP